MKPTVRAAALQGSDGRPSVGLLSIPRYYNHGTQLQLHALQTAIADLGYDCRVLDYRKEFVAPLPVGSRLRTALAHPGRVGPALVQRGVDRYIDSLQSRALQRARSFEAEELRIAQPLLRRFDDFHAIADRYDAFVVGSDQLWNPLGHLGDRAFMLEFAPPRKRIAYAPSVGVSRLEADAVAWLRDGVRGIPHLSVREATGARLLAEIAGVEAEVVVDPTLLHDRAHYERLAAGATRTRPRDPYVLQYALCEDRYLRTQASDLARALGARRVVLPKHRVDVQSRSRNTIKAWGVGPREFLDLISGAAAVVTDSFHGSVFSILFGTPFFTFRRYDDLRHGASFSRVEDLFARTGLSDRIVGLDSAPATADRLEVDFATAHRALAAWRTRSRHFLASALRTATASAREAAGG